MVKKFILAMIGLTFAFSVTSCKYDAEGTSCEKKGDKAHSEKHHDRW